MKTMEQAVEGLFIEAFKKSPDKGFESSYYRNSYDSNASVILDDGIEVQFRDFYHSTGPASATSNSGRYIQVDPRAMHDRYCCIKEGDLNISNWKGEIETEKEKYLLSVLDEIIEKTQNMDWNSNPY